MLANNWSVAVVVAACSCASTQVGSPATPQQRVGPDDVAFRLLSERPAWLFSDFSVSQCPVDVFPGVEQPFTPDACTAGVQACVDHCQSKDGNACYALALHVQAQKGRPDVSEALFFRACSLGIASGCTNRAAGLLTYPTKFDPLPCANRTFEAMCDRDDPWACTMWGASLLHGRGIKRDVARAVQILPKGCRLGADDEACVAARRELQTAASAAGSAPVPNP